MENEGKLIYEELSYKIIGCLFEVFNKIGGCHKEVVYQRALAALFRREKIGFREQVYQPLEVGDSKVGSYYLDFLIEEKIILEIKRKVRLSAIDYQQVKQYLKATGLKLGILASFTEKKVKHERVLNLY
jgi:GxxExxY protein